MDMKKTHLAYALTAISLTGCATQSLPQSQPIVRGGLTYPNTATHAQKTDRFLSGEYGRPDDMVGAGVSSNPLRPDDGIDQYKTEVVVDEFRWLENIDPINVNYRYEKEADRQRNTIGTRLEDDQPEGQFDNRTQESLTKIGDNPYASDVNEWVEAQNATTQQYFAQVPYTDKVYANVKSLMNYRHNIDKVRTKIGKVEYYRNTDGNEQIKFTDLAGNERIIYDEATALNEGRGKNYKSTIYVSETGKHTAFYLYEGNGDNDLIRLYVLDTATGKNVIKPMLIQGRNPPGGIPDIVWQDDDRFYYVCEANNICLYDVRKPQFNPPIEVAYEDIEGAWISNIYFEDDKPDDKRYMVIEVYDQKDSFVIKDRQKKRYYRIHNAKFKREMLRKNIANFGGEVLAKMVHFDPKTRQVWFISTENNPKGEILSIQLDKPNERKVAVPTPTNMDRAMDAIYHEEGEGYFVVSYLKDGLDRLWLVNKAGQPIKDITPSKAGHVSDLVSHVPDDKANKDDKKDEFERAFGEIGDYNKEPYIEFRYRNTITPRTIYRYSIAKDAYIDVRRRDLVDFDSDKYEFHHILYPSKDGTMIPMTISHKKGIKLDGKNPTMLYGYGGFGVDIDSSFRMDHAAWLEHGGIWANAFIRGGSEYGSQSANAGRLYTKMNVFDDFAAAADYLAQHGYADSDHLAITGSSNGGLLVGASMTLHPEKFRVALPDVGVLDMLRHDRNFTNQHWSAEYGHADDSAKMYRMLKSYSPYHNIKAGVCYPSTLIHTGKRDDRVTPSHSYKFAAALQKHQACDRPTILQASPTQWHHPFTRDEMYKRYGSFTIFALHEMGVKGVPDLTQRASADSLKSDTWKQEERQERAIEERQKQSVH